MTKRGAHWKRAHDALIARADALEAEDRALGRPAARASASALRVHRNPLRRHPRRPQRNPMKNERRALGRIAALVATALSRPASNRRPGSNGTGAVPSTLVSFVATGTLVGVEPFSVGTTMLETGTTAFRQDETASAGGAGCGSA
jgi:hypothetical protein